MDDGGAAGGHSIQIRPSGAAESLDQLVPTGPTPPTDVLSGQGVLAMNGDPGVLQGGATPNGSPLVVWSVLRAGVFGLAAAVAGACLYAAFVILFGDDSLVLAMSLGVGVGFAVAAGRARIAEGWVRALSVVLTLFSLLLWNYLVLWLYDGEGFDPVPISVGEAATVMRDRMVEDPVWSLLSWGLALVTAYSFGKGKDSAPDDQVSAHSAPVADPDTDPDLSWPLVQIVEVDPHPLRAADLELAVILCKPSGGFWLRRVSLVASDLPSALPHLFDADPHVLASSGTLFTPCRVVDQAHDSAGEAMAAAHSQHPVAHPDHWGGGADFCSAVEENPGFAGLLKPEAERVGALGTVVVGVVFLAVAAAVIYAGYRLNVWVGLDTPERKDTLTDQIFALVVVVLAGALAVVSGRGLARLLARRNLAKATAQASMPNARLDEGSPSLRASVGRGHRRIGAVGRRQRTAIAVAAIGCISMLAVVTVAARTADDQIGRNPLSQLPSSATVQAQDRIAMSVRAATIGCGICLAMLLWAWLRAPQVDHPEKSAPPIGFLLIGAALSLVGWVMAFGIDLEFGVRPVWWDLLFAVVGGAAVAWTLWIVTGWSIWISADANPDQDAGEGTVTAPYGRQLE